MIRYLNHNAIDRKKWDDLVAAHGWVYAQFWYLDIVHPDWAALVLDDYEAAMPLTGDKKFGVQYLFQPFFCAVIALYYLSGFRQISTKYLDFYFFLCYTD